MLDALDPGALVESLDLRIESSSAHQSRLYARLASEARLAEIVSFLIWDAEQPPYNVFLRRWLPKAPAGLLKPLEDHIALEERERHSELFNRMMDGLLRVCRPAVSLDRERLRRLNYTFSRECADRESFGFFVGGFLATEKMAAKRCRQLHAGLRRAGVASGLEYLTAHMEADDDHARQARELFAAPLLELDPSAGRDIERGLADRLERSGEFLSWYEDRFLPPLG